MLGSGFFALQSVWCQATSLCFDIGYDPNAYRALLRGAAVSRDVLDQAIQTWLFAFFMIGGAMGIAGFWLMRRDVLTDRIDPIAYGWLNPAVQAVKKGNAFVVAYVLTKTNHEGASVAYEGVVQQLALDEDQSIKLVVLNEVDRFLVKITDTGIERLDAETTPITQLQITAAKIANIALEVVRAEDKDVAAIEAEA